MAKNRITLNICGCELTLSSEENETDVRAIGDEVQKAISGLMDKNGRISVTMAAVIAALDYCDASHKASAAADNLRSQIKNYLEDSSHARMDAEESHRELERVRRENQTLRARLAAAGDAPESQPTRQPAPSPDPAPQPNAPAPEEKSAADADQETFMSFFEKKANEQ